MIFWGKVSTRIIKLSFWCNIFHFPLIHHKPPPLRPEEENIHLWKTESWFFYFFFSDEARSGGEDESAGLRGRGDSVQEELQRGAGEPEQGEVGVQGGARSFFKSEVGFDTGVYFFSITFFSPPFEILPPPPILIGLQAGVARCGFESIGTS